MSTDNHTPLLYVQGLGFIALPTEQLHEGLRRGAELVSLLQPGPTAPRGSEIPPSGSDGLLDAAAISKATGVPASWFLSAARTGKVPCVHFGRWPRFSLADVTHALQQVRKGSASDDAAAPLQLPPSQRLSRAKRNGARA